MLNTRTTDFDEDYEQFQGDMEDLRLRLQEFCDSSFEKVNSCMNALNLLERFERIKHVGLNLDDKYNSTFELFGKEVEDTRKVYQRDRNDPPIARNLPPMAVSISLALLTSNMVVRVESLGLASCSVALRLQCLDSKPEHRSS